MPEVTYPWPQFWVPQHGVIDLSDGGFLRDPTDWLAGIRGPMPLAALQHWRALALLGEPGIGKSTTLKEEADRVASLATTANLVSVYVDLRTYSSNSPPSTSSSKAIRSSLGKATARTCFCISTASTKRFFASTRSPICSPPSCHPFRRSGYRSGSPAVQPYGQPQRWGPH